jgi:hypothetical protein
MKCHDIHGREIKEGDIIRIPHFTTSRGRKVFMYKLVVSASEEDRVIECGGSLYGVCIGDIARKGSLDKAHKFRLYPHYECQIIDGGTVAGGDLFWTRPIKPKASDTVHEATR